MCLGSHRLSLCASSSCRVDYGGFEGDLFLSKCEVRRIWGGVPFWHKVIGTFPRGTGAPPLRFESPIASEADHYRLGTVFLSESRLTMKSSGMETRNTKANPRGNSGTSLPQSCALQYWETTFEVVGVWTITAVVDAVLEEDWLSPSPPFEALTSVQSEVELEGCADSVSVT